MAFSIIATPKNQRNQNKAMALRVGSRFIFQFIMILTLSTFCMCIAWVIVWQHTNCAQVFVCAQPQGHGSWIERFTDAATGGGVRVLVKVWAALSLTRGRYKAGGLATHSHTHKRTCLSPHSLLILASCAASCGEHPSPLTAETAETLSRTTDQ